ncbi:tRNA (adenosine(37)-N6)-threonylcarbamoyltransferase complex dimerization subunit type 1 TsaB [Crenothrix polyspora]|uniref:tRNA threonylcarbamoyladenosine biosynthesis protein TsaB n=1 Tax=Crenothrix polyspora TaxID=360316 RepID=A0A1R4H2V6_9GAMM|nr:tRNA (adenosine(37)-N6)-threonylcarbamoyltransferase complex dimerization subunit type 1 TsaB [Crenothrix polyspora]SJM90583.1 putative peptidase [Crenothrix polyspora]
MKLLAVETATEACSAALFVAGGILERFEIAPQQHTKLILPMIDSLLAEAGLKPADLDALAFGCGPGSFTGVRIATGVIQGIAFGLDIPVVPVSTLAALAQGFFNHNTAELDVVFAAMDARLGEIFWGVYQRDSQGFAQLIGQEVVTPASLVVAPELRGIGVGSAWSVYQDELQLRLDDKLSYFEAQHLPSARTVAKLGVHGFAQGLAVGAELAMPVYLRDKVAKTELERKSV